MSIVENNITNHLFNTSFNPFDENLISITRNSSKTGKDFFFNNQEKNFCLSQIHKNFMINNLKRKREHLFKLIKKNLKTSNSFYSINNNLITPITNYSSFQKFNESIKKPLPKITKKIKVNNSKKEIEEEKFKRDYYYEENKLLELKHNKLRRNYSINCLRNNYYKKPIKEEFQFFGSSSSKYLKKNNNNEKVGPGSYFKENECFIKKRIFKYNPKVIKLRKSESENNMIPGPGNYNIAHNFLKKNFSNIHSFNSCEKRFKEKHLNENFPGPGNYIKLIEWNNNNNNNNNKKYIYKTLKDKKNKKEEKDLFSTFDYDSNIYSIEKKNEKKMKLNLNNSAPFGIQSKKFEKQKFSTGENIGPGTYTKNIINYVKKNNRIIYYKEKEEIFNNQNKLNLPNYYGEDSYFDWHKKSYNIQYV